VDKFTAYSLSLMLVITAILVVATYIGQASGGELEGTDGIVEDTAASTAGVEPVELIPAIPEDLEPVGFTLAGIVGGFIFGFLWYDVFERRD